MSIILKNAEQIEGIRKSSKLAAACLDYLETIVKPGISTAYIDQQADEWIRDHKAIPACLNYEVGGKKYPKSICTSVNEVICHGIPDECLLKNGDIINVDVTTILDGYFGDTSTMFAVGEISKDAQRLLNVTKQALFAGIAQVYPGNKLGNIGHEISKYAIAMGYSVVDSFCGHGTGIQFHEEPQVPHISRPNEGCTLREGMIFTIEPMLNEGVKTAIIDPQDGWTVRTADKKLSAQYEHTLLVTDWGVEVLTLQERKKEYNVYE